MTKEELIAALRALFDYDQGEASEEGHMQADALLVSYINDPEITEAYNAIGKWYS